MKNIIFCFHFIRKNLFPILLTLLILTFTFFYMITIIGKVQYKMYAYDRIRSSGLEDSLYVMPAKNEGGTEIYSSQAYREEVSRMDGVDMIVSFRQFTTGLGDYPINVFCYPSGMIDHFQQRVKEGHWLDNNSETVEAVIGGVVWPGIRVGDIVTLDNGLACRVVGILANLVVFPAFSRYSNSACPADYLFKAIDNVIFLNYSAVELYLSSMDNFVTEPPNFFVKFSETASLFEREKVLEYLQNIGIVRTYEDITSDSEELFKEWVKEQFPLPIFLLVIATINTICICAVMLHRSLPDISKYYLLGCTRRYAAVRLTAGMGILFSIPAVLNIILALLSPNFLRYRINGRIYDYLIDIQCLIPVAVHMVLILLIIGFLTYLSFRKYSPFDFYRRNL